MFKILIFDLDDTLLDTYNLLIPEAVKKAGTKFQMLTGLTDLAVSEFSFAWTQLHTKFSGIDLFEKIVEQLLEKYKISLNIPIHTKNIIQETYTTFQQPDIPPDLKLPTATLEMLSQFKQHYTLYLVTQGNPKSQEEKIKKLNIMNFFKKIFIINPTLGETKTDAFNNILKIENYPPSQILSIGNRLSHEISMSKKLGIKTCHIAFGEHKEELPKNTFEIADWTISSLSELKRSCHL
jgi:FMN phosphatase YigB (HAD superfamily)